MPATESLKTSPAGPTLAVSMLLSYGLHSEQRKLARSCFQKKSFRVNTIGFLAHDIVTLR